MGAVSTKRQAKIKNLLAERGEIFVDELSKRFDISKVTIRRDLIQLEKEGCLLRTYGGAVKAEGNIPLQHFFEEKAKVNVQEKQAIAAKALRFIEKGMIVFLDSGTTVWELAKLLRGTSELLRNICVVTSSIPVIWELSRFENVDMIVLGGKFRPELLDLCGPQAEKEMKQYTIDIAFLGVDGISHEKGLSTTDFHTAHLEQEVIKSSKKVIVLADHSKVGRSSFISYGDIGRIDMIITDSTASKGEVAALGKLVTVVTA